MPSYLHPGVYIEEVPSGSKPIEGVSTSVTAFVGSARRGPAGKATLIQKLDDYTAEFGEIASEDDAMGFAVQAFYLNGGGAAYICRLVGDGSSTASGSVRGQGVAGGGVTAQPALSLSATSEGEWANNLIVKIDKPDQDSLTFDLQVGSMVDGEFSAEESFSGLTMVEGDDNYALTVVNDGSSLVELALGGAAEIGGASEQYQAATVTSGEIPTTATHFSAGITVPMVLGVNINGLGTKQITVDPSAITLAGADVDVDAAAVAAEVQAQVRALSSDTAYQSFTCAYSSGTNRFALSTPEDDSQSSIEISDGTLAKLMRLDSGQKAQLTGAALASSATLFSSGGSGIPSLADTSLTLDIDHYGSFSIILDVSALSFAGVNATDGKTVALAIQNAVRAVTSTIPSFKDFTCKYNDARQFVLTSGSSNVRRSGLAVTDGALADLLGLNAADTPTLVVGRQAEQGTANVVPVDNSVTLAGGAATSPTPSDYGNFYSTVLRKVRDVSIMVLPGQTWAADGSGNAAISQTLSFAETYKRMMVIVDPEEDTELDQAATVNAMGLPTSTYSALYYPWVEMANPLYNVDTNPTADPNVAVAPSAIAAGIWAKTDGKRGVWKAPAGVETQLLGAAGLQYNVEDGEQDQLNPLGVNCVRKLPGFGSVVWGSRTLATKAAPEWRYVPVRRTAIFIEQSIYNGIQWAVFEPNDHPLWGSLRGNIGAFMNGLFRAGAFQGATAKEAYFVRCGLGDTMTQGDIDRGQVIVMVGFAPLKPAEFVIVRIQQKVGQQ